MSLLVSGLNGFVGGHLGTILKCTPMLDDGKEVDLRDEESLTKCIKKIQPTSVIHLAAQSYVPKSFEDPIETFEVNFLGTYNLLKSLKLAGFEGRMVYVGTGDIYGKVDNAALPLTEDNIPKPRNPYAVSKVAAEALCYQWTQTEQFSIVVARPFNHIGPGQSERFVASKLAKQVVEVSLGMRNSINVGNLNSTRDFTDVRDIVRAYAILLERGSSGEVYNVCSGREVSISSILKNLLESTGVSCRIVEDHSLTRANEQQRMVGSYKKLMEHTGWSPRIELDKTLGDLLAYWREKLT